MPVLAQIDVKCYNMPVHTREGVHMRKRIVDVEDLGKAVRLARKGQGLTQKELSDFFSIFSREFLSDLENGKKTVEMNKALAAAHSVGLRIYVESDDATRQS